MRYVPFMKLQFQRGIATMMTLALLMPNVALAQTVAADGATNVYNAANGVPVVDIAKANGAGLSHNRYNDYNVDARGMVLNNGDISQISHASQLAGQVAANPNLTTSARVILNEVVTNNRSALNGYTEVVGKSADVIVANPNGVTCNGCGFINTPNVTMTTGKPQIGANGALNGFAVDKGDIVITGKGLDATAQENLALVSRSAKIDAQINARNLEIITGKNDVDYATRNATPRAADGNAPTYAVDSSALGGMYANKIRLVATEAGVGVRMLGDAAAGVDDFTINANGKIELGNKISAARDVKITSANNNIEATNAKLSAKRDIGLRTTAGTVKLRGGTIAATQALTINSANLDDQKTVSGDTDNNKRHGKTVTLTHSDDATLDGTGYSADNALQATASTLNVGADGVTLQAGTTLDLTTTGALTLGNAAIKSAGNLNLASVNGALTTASGTGQGIVSSNGDITLGAYTGLNNGGVVSADNGSVIARVGSALTNNGTLFAKTAMDLADENGLGTSDITNNGTMLSNGTLAIKADDLVNNSNAQGTNGTTIAANTVTNAGKLILSDNAANSGSITANTLTNTSLIQSARDLTLTLNDTLTNSDRILAGKDLSIAAKSNAALTVANNGGRLQAAKILSIKGNNGGNNATMTSQTGTLFADTLDLNLAALTNDGTIQGGTGASKIYVANALTNNASAKMYLATAATAGGTVNAGTLTNYGILQSAGELALNIGTQLRNDVAGKIYAVKKLVVRGLNATAYNILNYKLIQSDDLLDIKGKNGTGAVTVSTNATSALLLGKTMDINAQSVTLADQSGLKSTGDMTVNTDTLSISGSGAFIVAASTGIGNARITVSNDLINGGTIFSGRDMTLTARNLTNDTNGGIGANNNLYLVNTDDYIDNKGSLYAGNLLDVDAAQYFGNQTSGTVDSAKDINIAVGGNGVSGVFRNNNNIIAGKNLTISSSVIRNEIANAATRDWGTNQAYSETRTRVDEEGVGGGYDETHYYSATWYQEQSYDGATPAEADRPLLIAGRGAGDTLTLKDFDTATNLGGVISAGIISLQGKAGSTFTNDSMDLEKKLYTATWNNWCDKGVAALPHYSCSWTYKRSYTESYITERMTTLGAGIYAGTLSGNNFSLTNISSAFTAQGEGSNGVSGGTGDATLASGAVRTGPQGGITFGGITLTLPTSPNGFFVVSKNPNSQFLVETNPLYTSASAGSRYLIDRLGLNPDMLQKRLGDGNYEASLVRQQLISQTGKNSLMDGETEEEQMLRLMNQGADKGKELGLTLGKAPTSAQLASLDKDMVWMVETNVNGQKVLAPVVYLSAQTVAMVTGKGATIAAKDVNLNVASLSNTGGTISGSNTLNVASQGDIKNTSGNIKGGNVSLSSTNGSIVNETYAHTTGGEGNQQTDIGKTGGITSTGDMKLDAKKDITNKGANVSAGGNASLNAGNNITFDTIENKKSSASGDSNSNKRESSTTNIKSGLTVGGNLGTTSGNNTTFAGTDVNVKGNADVKAGGDMNIIARDDKTSSSSQTKSGNVLSGTTHTDTKDVTKNVGSNFNVGGNLSTDSKGDTTIQGSTVDVKGDGAMHAGGDMSILDGHDTSNTTSSDTTTGLGVGGGVYGTNTEADKNRKSTSVGSGVSFGGNGSLSSDKSVTVQGSNVEAKGDLDVKAVKNVNVIEGRDIDESSHTSTTVTFGKVHDGEGSTENKAGASAGTNGASANAQAGASSESKGSGGVSLMEADVTQTDRSKSTAKGSSLKSGGNMNVEAGGDTTLRGANVEAGGDLGLSGTNVNIETAKDYDTTTTKSNHTQVGIYADSENKAEASADASAKADKGDASASGKAGMTGGGAGYNAANASADAEVNAGASATTENTLDFMQTTTTGTTTKDVTNKGSTIKSGGNTKIKAKQDVNVKGSDVEAGGDMDVDAKNINVTAEHDTHDSTTTSNSTRAGMYNSAGVDASANANAGASAKGLDASAGASAEANANVESGYRLTNTQSDSSEGSSKAKTSSLKSGGNMTRSATDKITDEGAQIEAGGDYTQNAKSWNSKAAADTSYSSESSETHTGKIGGYGTAGASAEYGANSKGEITNEAGANASAGIKAQYEYNKEGKSESASNAVTGSIKSGGKMMTNTQGKASLEGTQLESGGDMEVNAGSLDYKAAKNTKTSAENKTDANAEVSVGVDVKKKVTATVAGDYEGSRSEDSSSEAVVGGMKSGGNLKVNTKDDARFEGTNIEAKDDASIKAGGNVTMDAAHNTASHTESGENASASLSLSKGGKGKSGGKGSAGMGLEAEGGFDKSTSSSSDAVTGSIKSGGKTDISAGKDATFEGTKMESGGDTSVDAKGDVNFNAAKSTKSEEGYGGSAELSLSKGGKDKKGKAKSTEMGASVEGNYNKSDETTSEAGDIKSGGNFTVKSGNDVNLEGTNIEAKDKASIDAKRDVNFKAKEDKAENLDVGGGLSLSKTKVAKGGDKAENGQEAGLSVNISGGKSNTKTGGSIKGGTIETKAGRNTTLEGTDLSSEGDATIKSGGDTTFKAAKSTSIDGSFSGSVGSGGTGSIGDAGIGGSVSHDTSKVNTGGNLKVESGGKTTLEGTKADVGGKADITGGQGVDKKIVVGGGGQIGLTRAGAEIDVQATDIKTGR